MSFLVGSPLLPQPPSDVSPVLWGLAPAPLPNFRVNRYEGDSICADVKDFAPEDQRILHDLYAFLIELLNLLSPLPIDAGKEPMAVRFAARENTSDLFDSVQQLGLATKRDKILQGYAARAVHDIRGGGLTAIFGRLQLLVGASDDASGPHPKELNNLFILARDHLKITRNAVTELDDAERNHDREHKPHHIDTIIEKWTDMIPGATTRNLPVRIHSRFRGNVSECCLESAALDRIFYNVIGNACRHCAGDHVQMDIFAVPGESGINLRFVVSNAMRPEDHARLRGLIDTDLSELFRAGVSSTGSGLGLAIVAEFVCQAFGLARPDDAVRQGYVGAAIIEQTFYAWFHWPAAKDEPPCPQNLL